VNYSSAPVIYFSPSARSRQVCEWPRADLRLGSLENLQIDVGLAIGMGEARRLADQAAGSDIVTDVVRYAQVLLG
jgi:hypothetical protein